MGDGSRTLNATITLFKCPNRTMNYGVTWANSVLSQTAPWKCSEKVFTPSLVSLLRRSSTVFHTNLVSVGTKSIVAFGPPPKTWSHLCSSWDLSVWADRWLLGQQHELHISELILISPLMLMYLSRHPPLLPSLAQSVLTANHLLWPRVLLLLCVCLPFFLPFAAAACCAPVYA